MMMRRKLLMSLFCVFGMHADLVQQNDPWKYVDFDLSMRPQKYPRSIIRTRDVMGITGRDLYLFFKDLYQKNNLTALRKRGIALDEKIPKVIHQIWIGGPLPEAFVQLCESWKHYHINRGWLYKLWTDEDVAELKLQNQRFFDQDSNPGVRSDLMRWEILYNFGGFYLDVDYECLQPLDSLLCYDFVTAIQPLDTFMVQLGNAFLGSSLKHPILKDCIETIKDDWHHKGAPKKTGPIHFTKSFYKIAGRNGKIDVALPPTHFYPLGCQEKEMQYEKWLDEGAYAVHHWAKSWMPPRFRLDQFKELGNEKEIEH